MDKILTLKVKYYWSEADLGLDDDVPVELDFLKSRKFLNDLVRKDSLYKTREGYWKTKIGILMTYDGKELDFGFNNDNKMRVDLGDGDFCKRGSTLDNVLRFLMYYADKTEKEILKQIGRDNNFKSYE